uniref:Uncharacterized protein n=1 Tax=Anguilla anguilla TaxID=7936 RepID=A0A0E9XF34_ANGAN
MCRAVLGHLTEMAAVSVLSCVLCTRIDYVDKLRLQGGSAHQETIHIMLGAQLLAVGTSH